MTGHLRPKTTPAVTSLCSISYRCLRLRESNGCSSTRFVDFHPNPADVKIQRHLNFALRQARTRLEVSIVAQWLGGDTRVFVAISDSEPGHVC